MKRILFALIVAVFVCETATPQNANGSVEGVVLRHGTNAPVADARVTIGRPSIVLPPDFPFENVLGPLIVPQTEIRTVTDSSGRFVFPNLDPGNYIVIADAEGYRNVDTYPGVRPQPANWARYVTLQLGERARDVALSLVPPARIAGVVRDAGGQARPGTDVYLGTIEYSDGRRQWNQVERVETNDRGEYQFPSLRPGEYYVVAAAHAYGGVESGPAGRTDPFIATYFPQAPTMRSATLITATAGSDVRADIDLLEKSPVWRSVSGTVRSGSLDRITVSLVPAGDDFAENSLVPYLFATVDPAGEFQINDVAPGSYDLYAVATQAARTYIGRLAIEVREQDLKGLRLALDRRTADRVYGRVVDDKGQELRVSSNLTLRARKTMPFFNENGNVHVADRPANRLVFEFNRVPPGIYDLAGFDLPSNTYVADILQGGRSILSSGLIIEGDVEPAPVEVSIRPGGGTVDVGIDANGRRSGLLVLVPDAPHREIRHLYRDINVSAPTSFEFENVRPGKYKVFAIESWLYEPYQTAYLNADFLANFERDGVAISVRDGETVNVRVTLLRK
jgi:hypothetical protein